MCLLTPDKNNNRKHSYVLNGFWQNMSGNYKSLIAPVKIGVGI